MRKIKEYVEEYAFLFLLYGGIYFIIECLWKHAISDWRMAVLGGVMGILIGLLNCFFTYNTDIFLQGIVGSLMVTLAEAVGGYQWNIVEGLGIWDYSALPLSGVNGQVNLFFSIGWFFLSLVCIFLDDAIDYYIVKHEGQEPPYYVLFGHKLFQMKEKD